MRKLERGFLVVGWGGVVLEKLLRKLLVHDGFFGRKDLVLVERRLFDSNVRRLFKTEPFRRSQRLLTRLKLFLLQRGLINVNRPFFRIIVSIVLIIRWLLIVCLVVAVFLEVLRAAVVLWVVLVSFFWLIVYVSARLVIWAFVLAQVMRNLAVYLGRMRSLWLCLFVFVSCCLLLAVPSLIKSVRSLIPDHTFLTPMLTFLQCHKHLRHVIRVIQRADGPLLRNSWLLNAQRRQNIHFLLFHAENLLNRRDVPDQQLFLHFLNCLVVPFWVWELDGFILWLFGFL